MILLSRYIKVEDLRPGFYNVFLLNCGFNLTVVLKLLFNGSTLSCIFYDVISALTTSLLLKWRDIDQDCSIFLQFQFRHVAFLMLLEDIVRCEAFLAMA